MRTQGVKLYQGSILVPLMRAVPEAFWARLKHQVQVAGLLEAFRADYRETGARLGEHQAPWANRAVELEEELFKRWVKRLHLDTGLWPWDRGWTEDLVDAYLVGEPARTPRTASRASAAAAGGVGGAP